MSQHEQTLDQLLRTLKVMSPGDRRAIEKRLSHLHRNYVKSRLRDLDDPTPLPPTPPEPESTEEVEVEKEPDFSRYSKRLSQHLAFLTDEGVHGIGSEALTPAGKSLLLETLRTLQDEPEPTSTAKPSSKPKAKSRNFFGRRRSKP